MAELPGRNASKAQTPDLVMAAQNQTLVACGSPSEWKAAARRHPDALPAKTAPGDTLKSFCREAGPGPAGSGPTCKG